MPEGAEVRRPKEDTMDSSDDQGGNPGETVSQKRGGPNYAVIVGAVCCLIWSQGAVRGLASQWDGFKPTTRLDARRVFRGVDATRRQMDAYIVQENTRRSQTQVMSVLSVLISCGLSFALPWGAVKLITGSSGVRCPHCMSRIHKAATVCPNCQRDTNPSPQSGPPGAD